MIGNIISFYRILFCVIWIFGLEIMANLVKSLQISLVWFTNITVFTTGALSTVKHFNFAGTIFRELRMTIIFARIKFHELKILSWSNKSAEFGTHIHALI